MGTKKLAKASLSDRNLYYLVSTYVLAIIASFERMSRFKVEIV